jgi:hypothetical protein
MPSFARPVFVLLSPLGLLLDAPDDPAELPDGLLDFPEEPLDPLDGFVGAAVTLPPLAPEKRIPSA